MKAFIVQFPIGVLACDENNNIINKMLFPKKLQTAAKLIMALEEGKVPAELEILLTNLKNSGYDLFVFENKDLADQVKTKLSVEIAVEKPSKAGDFLRSQSSQVAVQVGFVGKAEDLSVWNHDISMEIAKQRVKVAVEKRDMIIAQAIQTLDDLDRTVNLFMGRLREWYGVHFPELDRLVEKHETYARLVLKLGRRENFSIEALRNEDIPESRTEQISIVADTSMGADVSEMDLAQITTLSNSILNMYELRKSMESYLDKTMEEVAPNVQAIVGSLLGARLIAVAGSLQNLAMRPSSTIQVLGAEKALFRSLKTGARPPKHGLIFQHALLHDAKKWQRGKIARAVAGKVAIAARIDAFGGKYAGNTLKASLEKRIEEIKEKYKEAPPVQEKKFTEPRQRPDQRSGWREDRPRRGGGDRRDRGNRGDRRPHRDNRRGDNNWRPRNRGG
jgi:nucleolar protein 56